LSQESKADSDAKNQTCLRLNSLPPPMSLLARNGKKRATVWLGYKVHFTQTCDEDAPQLITHVQTTPAPHSDEGVLSAIHADLTEKELLPGQHLVDAGYVTIANLVASQSGSGVDLVGLTHFSIDWEAERVICPQGRSSSSWTAVQDAGKSLIKVKFSKDVIVRSVSLEPAGRERLDAA
jgi:transposase